MVWSAREDESNMKKLVHFFVQGLEVPDSFLFLKSEPHFKHMYVLHAFIV